MSAIIRPATEADLPAIVAIANEAVENSAAIWSWTKDDDQLSMPGYFDDLPVEKENESPWNAVRWRQPGGDPIFGGGDLYLLSCTARYPRWSIAPATICPKGVIGLNVDCGDRPLSPQYRRMMTCVAKGFVEVYDRGPRTIDTDSGGTITPHAWAVGDDYVDKEIKGVTSALDPRCWSQRATNQSMCLSAAFVGKWYCPSDLSIPKSFVKRLRDQCRVYSGP